MVRGSVSLVANETRLTDEVFAANVAFLRENIDQMFVLLMGAITCFLQVFSVHPYPHNLSHPLYKGRIWNAGSWLCAIKKHDKHSDQEFWGPLPWGGGFLCGWLWLSVQRGQRLGW